MSFSRTVIVAGNLNEYREWCIKRGLEIGTHRVLYCKSAEELAKMGLAKTRVIATGTYEQRPDLAEIKAVLASKPVGVLAEVLAS